MKEIERIAIAKNNVLFLVIPAKAGIQNLDPGSKPAPDHDPGSEVTGRNSRKLDKDFRKLYRYTTTY